MTDINRIVLTGNVGKDPDFKHFESGAMLTEFTLACARYDGKLKQDITDWFTVKTFSKIGEYILKGYKIAIEGKLVTNAWKTESGENRKSIYIMADTIQILTPRPKMSEVEEEIAVENGEEINMDEIPF